MKNFIKKNYLYISTFIISLILVCIIYAIENVTPFGKKSLTCGDFYLQYSPMMVELKNRILSSQNLIYSFTMSSGLPFFRNFFNYLSSPFNILLFLFNYKNLFTSYSFIIGLKIVFASVFMVYYLSKHWRKSSPIFILLSLLYAFSGYFGAYYSNLMWLDGLVFLPLIVCGVEKIVNEKKFVLYLASLSIMLFANYYIGYIICFFIVLYFIVYLFTTISIKQYKDIIVRCLIFAFSSICAGGLIAWALLPVFDSLLSTSATSSSQFVLPTYASHPLNVLTFFKAHLSSSAPSIFFRAGIILPNISCGILGIILFLNFFINKEINLKTKFFYLFLYLFFVVAFFNTKLDYILHAFHIPNDYPYRYSFVYEFIFILLASYSVKSLKNSKFTIPLISGILCAALIAVYFLSPTNLSKELLIFEIISIPLYLLAYFLYKKIKSKKVLFIIFVFVLIVISVEIVWSMVNYFNVYYTASDYYTNDASTHEILGLIKDDTSFYRIGTYNHLTSNDGSAYNYMGCDSFSSMEYEGLAKFQWRLGLPSNQINSYQYVRNTPIYDLMFTVKYIIGYSQDPLRYEFTPVENNPLGGYSKNKYNLSFAYGVSDDLLCFNYINTDPFKIQNSFISTSTGINGVLEPTTISEITKFANDDCILLKYSIEKQSDYTYFYSSSYNIKYIIIGNTLYTKNDFIFYSLGDVVIENIVFYDNPGVIQIDTISNGCDIYIGYTNYRTNVNDFSLYTLNTNKFEEAYNILSKNQLICTNFKENEIYASANLENDMLIYTSIPFDKGWNVFIDGKKVETFSIANALLAFNCPSGEHEITFKYEIPYFKIGLLISFISFILLILVAIIKHKRKPLLLP